MALSRSNWRLTRLQTIAAISSLASALCIAPWVMINCAVGGHAKFQPIATLIGYAGLYAYQHNNDALAKSLLETAVNCHIGDLSDDTGYAYFAHWLAGIEYGQNHYINSERLEQSSASSYEKAFGEYSYSALLGRACVADNLLALGRFREAEDKAKCTLFMMRCVNLHNGDLLKARLQHILSDIYLDLGLYNEAEAIIPETLAIEQKGLGEGNGWTLLSLHNLAVISEAKGQHETAAKQFDELFKLETKYLGAEHRWTAGSKVRFALASEKSNVCIKPEGLEKICAEAVERTNLKTEQVCPNFCGYARSVGRLCLEQGKFAEANRLFNMSYAIARADHGEEHPCTILALQTTGELKLRQGRYAEAESILAETLRLKTKVLGEVNADTAQTMMLLGRTEEELGHGQKACEYYEKAMGINSTTFGWDAPVTQECKSMRTKLLSLGWDRPESEEGRWLMFRLRDRSQQ